MAFVGRVLGTVPTKHPFQTNSWTSGYSMRFAVAAALKGSVGAEVTIETGNGGGDCGTPLRPGGRFLVFAYTEKDGRLWTGMCSGNEELSDSADGEQALRQYKELVGKNSATIFGHIFSVRPAWQGDDIRGDAPRQPYRGMVVRAQSDGFSPSTKTKSDGSYEFNELPVGKYKIAPEVPKTLDFSHEYEENYEADLTGGQCANISFMLQPNTRIRGHLTLPPGMQSKAIEVVAVPTSLKELNQFSGKSDFTDENNRFDLWPLPPGDYYVGVNINSSPSADAPFPPTYYPGVTNEKHATVVSVRLSEVKDIELPIREIAKSRSIHFVAIGLDGKPMKTIYIQLEDLRHPGDAASYVNVDLDETGSASLTVYTGYSYHLHGSHWVGGGTYWCSKPVEISAGSKPLDVQFVMDRTSSLCEIDKIDGGKK